MATTVRDILLRFTGDADPANREVDSLAAHLQQLDGTDVEAAVTLAKEQFEAEVAKANAELDRLGSRDVSAKVRLKIDDARADMKRIAEEASAAFETYFTPKMNNYGVSKGIIGDLSRFQRDIDPVLRSFRKIDAEIEDVGDKLDQGAGFLTRFGDKVSQIQPIAGGLATILLLALAPALVAVGAAALSALAGIAALATGFVATLLPAIIPVVAAIGSITGVVKALQARSQAEAQADADAEAAGQRAAQRAAAQRAREIALRDAIEAKATAERHYAEAVADAQRRIKDARRDVGRAEDALEETRYDARRQERDANRRTIDAQKRIKQAVKDAHKAWQDALQKTKDEAIELEQTQWRLLDAQDRLWLAQNAFNSLLNQIPSDRIGDVLKKLEDVNLPEDQAIGFIQQAGGMNQGDAHRLYRAYLDLKKAELDVKDATNDLTKAQREKAAADAAAAKFVEQGIKAYEPYIAALKAAKDAKRDEREAHRDANRAIAQAKERVAEARAELARYIRLGVSKAPEVVNAWESVRDAQQRVREAQWQLRHGAAAAGDTMVASARRARAEWEKLTPAQKRLGNAIDHIRSTLRESGLGDMIVGALATAINALSRFIKSAGPIFGLLGKAMGNSIRDIAKAADSDGARRFFVAMTLLARTLADIGTDIFISMARAFAHIAAAAAPSVVRVMQGIADAMDRFADWSGTTKGQDAIGRMIDAAIRFSKVLGRVMGMLSRLIGLATPFGLELAEAFGKWADGLFRGEKGGDRVKDFFKATIPFAKSLAKFVYEVVSALLKVFEFAAPILKPFVDMATSIVKTISDVVGFLNRLIPAPIREVAGYIGALVIGAPKLVGWVGKLPGILGKIAKAVAGLGIVRFILNALEGGVSAIGKAAEKVGKAIADGVVAAAEAAWNLGKKMAEWVANAVKDAGEWVAGVGGKIIDGIAGGFGDAAAFGKKVLTFVVDGIAAAASATGQGAVAVGSAMANWLATGLGAIAGWGAHILRAVRDSISTAAKATGEGAISAGSAIAKWILAGIKDAASFGGAVLNWVRNAIGDAISKGANVAAKLGNWLLSGLKAVGGVGASIMKWLRDRIGDAIDGGAAVVAKLGNWIWRGIKSLGNLGAKLVSWLGEGTKDLIGFGARIADAIWDGIKGLPARIVGAVTGAWKAITEFITGKSVKLAPGGMEAFWRHQYETTPHKPGESYEEWKKRMGLADGGLVTRATVRLIGEGKDDEAVLPLNRSVYLRLGEGVAAALRASTTPTAPTSALTSLAAGGSPEPRILEHITEEGDTYHIETHEKQGVPDPGETAAAISHRQRQKGAARGSLRRAA